MPAKSFSKQTTGSPQQSTDGTDTVLIYTASGTLAG
jgi:hypothetical protein